MTKQLKYIVRYAETKKEFVRCAAAIKFAQMCHKQGHAHVTLHEFDETGAELAISVDFRTVK